MSVKCFWLVQKTFKNHQNFYPISIDYLNQCVILFLKLFKPPMSWEFYKKGWYLIDEFSRNR